MASGLADLEAYGQMVLANPDFVARLKTGAPMNEADGASFFGGVGTVGDLVMQNAYTWHGDITQIVTVDDKSEESTFAQRDQIAPEILHFSDCIHKGREPEPSGERGV